MPRYRFRWENLPMPLLSALGSGLKLEGSPAESLSIRYGVRPKELFIQEAWPILLGNWLHADSISLSSLAKALRKRSLGEIEIVDDYEYIKTCKNTTSLRQEALNVLFIKGEQSDALEEQASSRAQPPKPVTAESGADSFPWQRSKSLDRDSLMDFALEAVACLYGVDKNIIYVDGDGDILAPSGSAAVFVSVIEGKEFRVFSPMVHGINICDDLYKALNEINTKLRFGRVFCIGDQIILEQILDAGHTSLYTLGFAVGIIGNIADFYDHKIQDRFGGCLFLREKAEDEINV